jgi:nicotinate phosphoribosyltransferase
MVYKLHEYDQRPRRKRSTGKATWPGGKQVFREYDSSRAMQYDTLALKDEIQPGTPLLETMMVDGRRLKPPTGLNAVRARVADQLSRLPGNLRGLSSRADYPVIISDRLRALTDTLDAAG